jgi:hypothetical protein
MVNARMVNVRRPYFFRATFCKIFGVSGRIPRFQNPFKYIGGFNLNHETVHFQAAAARRNRIYICNIKYLPTH